jgi:hypothetical protein
MVSDGPATCPLCGEEKANAKSVEQHISGSADPVHKGEHGPDHREEIEAGESPDPDAGDEPGGDAGGDSGGDSGAVSVDNPRSGGPPSEDRDSTEREASTVPAPGDGGSVEDGDDQEGGDGGLMGMVVLIGLMIVLAAITPNNGQTAPRHPLQP